MSAIARTAGSRFVSRCRDVEALAWPQYDVVGRRLRSFLGRVGVSVLVVLACRAERPAAPPADAATPTRAQLVREANERLRAAFVPVLPASGHTTIPIAGEPDRPIVELDVGGPRPLRMLLDTGAPYTVITTAMQRELQLAELHPGARALVAGGLGDWKTQPIVVLPRARLGDASFDGGVLAVGMPGEDLPRDPCDHRVQLDGIVGWSWLAGSVVTLDVSASRVAFSRERAVHDAELVTRVPLLHDMFRPPRASIEIDGRSVEAMIDTGAHLELIMTPTRFAALDRSVDDADVMHLDGASLASGGIATDVASALVEVRMGTLALPTTTATIVESPYAGLLLLGMAVLGGHRIVIDGPGGVLELHRPREAPVPREVFALDWSVDAEGAHVRTLWRGSAPAQQGVAIGDPVTSVDGVALAGLSTTERCAILTRWYERREGSIVVRTAAGDRTLQLRRMPWPHLQVISPS